MSTAAARTRAKKNYNQKAYDRVSVSFTKGVKEVIRAHAVKRGESLAGFITRAIWTTIQQDEEAGLNENRG